MSVLRYILAKVDARFMYWFILASATTSTALLNFRYRYPYRLYNADIYEQLADVNHFATLPVRDPYFINGPADLHSGPYNYVLFLLGKLTGLSNYDTILIAGSLNVALIVLALYHLGKSFKLDQRQITTLVILALFGWGSYQYFFAGLFEYSNLLVAGSLPATFGISLLILVISTVRRYLERRHVSHLVVLISLLVELLYSHLLSGIITIAFVALQLFLEIFSRRRLTIEVIHVVLGIVISIILSLFLWPPFSVLDIISTGSSVHSGSSKLMVENHFKLLDWPSYLGLSMLGLAFVPRMIKDKQGYFFALGLVSAIMTVSYIFPYRISLYWRFFPFLYFGLAVSFALYISAKSRLLYSIVISLVLMIGLVNVTNRLSSLMSLPIDSTEAYPSCENIKPNSVVLSDPFTSYHIAALFDVNVIAVPQNHSNPANPRQREQYYAAAANFLQVANSKDQQRIVDEYHINYVLINPNYYPDSEKFSDDRTWVKNFKLTAKNDELCTQNNMTLYRVYYAVK